MTYHNTLTRNVKNKKADNTKCWQDCGATLSFCWWKRKNHTATLEKSFVVSYKIKHTFTQEKWKSVSYRNMYMKVCRNFS